MKKRNSSAYWRSQNDEDNRTTSSPKSREVLTLSGCISRSRSWISWTITGTKGDLGNVQHPPRAYFCWEYGHSSQIGHKGNKFSFCYRNSWAISGTRISSGINKVLSSIFYRIASHLISSHLISLCSLRRSWWFWVANDSDEKWWSKVIMNQVSFQAKQEHVPIDYLPVFSSEGTWVPLQDSSQFSPV